MRLTLKKKREILTLFKSGREIGMICVYVDNTCIADRDDIEQVLRDYMNGKFKMSFREAELAPYRIK